MVSFAGYPLVVDDVVVGVIAMFSRSRLDEQEFETLSTAADAVSVAVANARAFAAEQVARQSAQAANDAKSRFVAQMSHELRTPLNAIGGYTELIALGVHGPVTPAQLAALDRIKQANYSLTALISDILSFAKTESGELAFRLADVDLGACITAAVALITPQATLAAQTLVVVPLNESPSVIQIDPDRLQQVLLNLLTNAVKYTPDGGSITVTAERVDQRYRITVRDTGIGIATDRLEAIFDAFVQLNRTLTPSERSIEGVGLGLPISRSLARAMHGDITVTSEVGVGSAFTLELPAHTPGRKR